jgi:hypothetical protein
LGIDFPPPRMLPLPTLPCLPAVSSSYSVHSGDRSGR